MVKEEYNKAWEKVRKIYRETDNPKEAADRIVKELGFDTAIQVFAAVAKIKERDGRIYGRNREWTKQIAIHDDFYKENNHRLISGLDDIHTSHIDQIITQLRLTEKERNEK